MAIVRRRVTTIAAKIETTQGTDVFAGSPNVATDFIKGDITITFDQQQINNPEMTGSLDQSASIAGGTKVRIEVTCQLKGSGTAGTAPQWGTLMQVCGYTQTLTATAVGAPTAATAGTATTATLATPFAATAELYRGMPITLSGNPATPVTTTVLDYTVGRLATVGYTFSPVLSTSTLALVPANVLYSPTSAPANMKSATVYCYMDGILWKVLGCVGNWAVDLTTGGTGTIKFTMTGVYSAPTATATPTNIVFDATQPPIFRSDVCRLNGALSRSSRVTFDSGNTLYEPENPEASEGFDPSVITVRDSKGTMDPLMNSVDTVARMAAFKAGTPQSANIVLGTVAGNMIGITAPSVSYTGLSPQNRSEAYAESISFDCNGVDTCLFLTVF
jgi:hypothetical protein